MMKRLSGASTSNVRRLSPADLPSISELYRQVFLSPEDASLQIHSAQALQTAFAEVFLNNPWYDEDIAPLICEAPSGKIIGFLAATVRPMLFRKRPIRAAVSAHLMTDPGEQHQMPGVKLLKAFFNGPQDYSLTDGANLPGRRIWEGLGGLTVPSYSFHWQRTLRPSRRVMTSATKKVPALSALNVLAAPLCRVTDAILTRLMPDRFQFPGSQAETAELNAEILSAGLAEVAIDSLCPNYDQAALAWLLNRSNRIQNPGSLQKVAVRNVKHELLGWFIYLLQPGGDSRVLQLAARRNALQEVFDHLCRHAKQRGATGLYGRAEPKQLPALAARRCSFTSGAPWLLAHSRNQELLYAIFSGDAFLSGLEGEWPTSPFAF